MSLELSKSVRTGIDKPSSVLAQLPIRLGSLQSFFQQACFTGPWFTEVQETISTLGGGGLIVWHREWAGDSSCTGACRTYSQSAEDGTTNFIRREIRKSRQSEKT